MIQQFADVLRKQIQADITNYRDDMARGHCRNYEEYAKLCGVIRGLTIAEEYLAALLERVDHDD